MDWTAVEVLAAMSAAAGAAVIGGVLVGARRWIHPKPAEVWPPELPDPAEQKIVLPVRRMQPPANPQPTIPLIHLADLSLQIRPPAQLVVRHPALEAAGAGPLTGRETAPSAAPAALEPSKADRLLADSILLVRQGALDRAELTLRCLLEAGSQPGQAWFWLGWVNARRGQMAEARGCFEQAQAYQHPEAERAIEWCRQPRTGRVL